MTHTSGFAGTLGDLPVLFVAVAAGVLALLRERRRQLSTWGEAAFAASPGSPPMGWLLVLSGASAVAAVVHAVVCPEHFQEYWVFGVFFLATAIAGLAYAVWVLARPARWLLTAGVVANLGIIALWLSTRLIGLPMGPDAGSTEPFGALDVVASSAELLAAGVAAVLLLRLRPQRVYVDGATAPS